MKLRQTIGVMVFLLVQGCAHHQTAERLPREHEFKPKELAQLQASLQKTIDKTQTLSTLRMQSPASH